jgi:hypothetical protein
VAGGLALLLLLIAAALAWTGRDDGPMTDGGSADGASDAGLITEIVGVLRWQSSHEASSLSGFP